MGGDAKMVTRLERVEATGIEHMKVKPHGDALRQMSDRNLLGFYREFVGEAGLFDLGTHPVHGRVSRVTAHLSKLGIIKRVRSYRGSKFWLTEYGWELLGDLNFTSDLGG
jgi:hypothetical protein